MSPTDPMQGPVAETGTAACARKARLADDSSAPAPSATFSNTPNTWGSLATTSTKMRESSIVR